MKRFSRYFISLIIIGIMIYFGLSYKLHLEKEASTNYIILPLIRFSFAFPIIIGILLRLPKLIFEIKEKKQWTFDWIKIVVIALPALFIAVSPFLTYTFIGQYFYFANELIVSQSTLLITIGGIIFGYVLLDSLIKDHENKIGIDP
ncbi:hypothetical protein ACQKND_18075 [Viridibacillus arvi]|uniref:hypothetical protein n=1 Tax=Viridibacillus arvi TaxID=263475 RepID=UPI003CFBE4F1